MPCLPNYQGPPDHDPTGTWNIDRPPPLVGIKPVLLPVPSKFKGDHDNIDRFLGNCQTYFETFWQYFILHPSMVMFTTSLLEGDTQDWWVYLRDL